MRISDWSSDVCASDLPPVGRRRTDHAHGEAPATRSCGSGFSREPFVMTLLSKRIVGWVGFTNPASRPGERTRTTLGCWGQPSLRTCAPRPLPVPLRIEDIGSPARLATLSLPAADSQPNLAGSDFPAIAPPTQPRARPPPAP